MNVQLNQLNELAQRKVESELKERKLTKEDIVIDVNLSKIEIRIISTGEIIKI